GLLRGGAGGPFRTAGRGGVPALAEGAARAGTAPADAASRPVPGGGAGGGGGARGARTPPPRAAPGTPDTRGGPRGGGPGGAGGGGWRAPSPRVTGWNCWAPSRGRRSSGWN